MTFTLLAETTLNRHSSVPFKIGAFVENKSFIILVKVSQSKSSDYGFQDIGCTLFSNTYRQHYDVSVRQYNEIFGINNWTRKILEPDDFIKWKSQRELIKYSNSDLLQEESWASTGHYRLNLNN